MDRQFTDEDADGITPPGNEADDWLVDRATRTGRLDSCRGCDRLFRPTYTCKECGCFMAAKTWLSNATCPLGRWS